MYSVKSVHLIKFTNDSGFCLTDVCTFQKLRLPTWHKVTGEDITQHAVVVEETDCSKSFVCKLN